MRYRLFGQSGLRVSQISLGTMTFGEDWGWGASREASREIFDRYTEAGGNFIDTADGYTNGNSERLVGEFIKGRREQYVVATKYSFNQRPPDPNAGGNHRKNMVQAVEGSLRRMDIDYIDLYWVHAWDSLTPAEEVMRGLDDLVRQGKVLYIGVSDAPAWVISRSNAIAELRGWTAFTGIQIEYSLIERTPERDLLPMASALGLAVTAWSPLASGLLTGKYKKGESGGGRLDQFDTLVELSDRNFAIVDAVKAVADEIGRHPAQVALAWVRQQGAIPIIGATKLSQLESNLASLELVLTPEHLARLDQASAPVLGFPHDFLRRPFVHNYLHGGIFDKIDR
ncbi:MAG: aldo/keto reductase [Bryobacteraceae bacterium]|nr:aldo/keto reductase [Bryobacteraceae bacterium]